MMLYCTEPFIIILPLSQYDLNNVERDVKHQIKSSLTLFTSRQQVGQLYMFLTRKCGPAVSVIYLLQVCINKMYIHVFIVVWNYFV